VARRARRGYVMARVATERKLPSADVADVADIMKKRSINSSDIESNSQSFSGLCVHLCHLRNLRTIDLLETVNSDYRSHLLHHPELPKIVRGQAVRLCE
jgi:hypothetical protein